MEIPLRLCQECNTTIKGRSDKRFCDDGCRNSYNNRINSDSNNYVRNINAILRKNRRILERLLAHEEKRKVQESKMLALGFQFKYVTHLYTTNKGHTYYFIYEYGYLALDEGVKLLVKRYN